MAAPGRCRALLRAIVKGIFLSQARRQARASHVAPRRALLSLPSVSTARPAHGRLIPGPLSAVLLGVTGGGFALLAATAPAQSTSPPQQQTAVLAAQSEASPELLHDDPAVSDELRASRSRRASAAVPEPEPAPADTAQAAVPVTPPRPAEPVLPGCEGRSSDVSRFANGRLPRSVLCRLPGDSGEQLRADAAVAFVGLAEAYQSHFGRSICVTDGYRTLGEQQQLRRSKPRLSARPGTSEHGWGLAVDLACGVQSFRSPQHAWMVQNAGRHGWVLPAWARRGGTKPEPWHWEFKGPQ